MGDVLKSLGGIAAPIVGLATGNPLLGALIGGGSSILGGATGAQGGIDPQSALMSGVMGGGAGFLGKNPDLMTKMGMMNQQGQLDPMKAAALGLGVGGLEGAQQQRKSAQDYTNSQIDLRNQLMSKILAPTGPNAINMQSQPNPAAAKMMQPTQPQISPLNPGTGAS